MNKSQRELMVFLKKGIRGEKVKFDEKVKWESILKLSEEHKVKGIIYSSIDWGKKLTFSKEIINTWKRDTFISAVSQSRHLTETANILNEFSIKDIKVIALKGLVVRELYPIPDLRTMSDSDILVHKCDLEKVSEILKENGYCKNEEKDNHGAHFIYTKDFCYPIEVHWTLINDDFFKGSKSFEEDVWDRIDEVSINGAKTYSLALEDLALHLCAHMAVHIAYGGFGVRQLCDLVLLVEKRGVEIDWDVFLNKVSKSGIDKFVFIIFKICNELFNMKIPFNISKEISFNRKYVDILIEDIFRDGVYASNDMHNVFANEFAFDKEEITAFKKFILFIFPPIKKMSEKYNYAKKYKLLIPIAWIHHLFSGITRNEYKFIDKVKFIFLTNYISRRKNKLLNWLEI
ncbi:MAG: nucleotidyltransferase domain-containing protein [Clostridium sp.]|uniref:nucleotidyltransferase domain-containing protein n=1 Tax=Clostridium sp. TaxID=1506 RepID=UPI003F301764